MFSLLPRRLCGFQKNEKQNEKQNENENENEGLAALTALGLRLFAAERSRGHTMRISFVARAKTWAIANRIATFFKVFSLLTRRLCGF